MSNYRSRLLFDLMIFIIIVLIGLGIILGQLFQTTYYEEFQETKREKMELTSLFLRTIDIFDEEATFEDLAVAFGEVDWDVTILGRDRSIVYRNHPGVDANLYASRMQNLLGRADRDFGVIHHVIMEDNVYYFAISFRDAHRNRGYLIMSASMDQVDEMVREMWVTLTVGIGLAFLIIAVLVLKTMEKYIKPIESITNVAVELTNGNYSARAYERSIDEMATLSESINVLARNLQIMKANDEMQRDRLTALIENVGSAIILIDTRGYLTLTNKAYKEWFEQDEKTHMNQLFYEAIPYKRIIQLVEDILIYEKAIRKQFVLPMNYENREFDVYGTPIIGTNEERKGILIVFHDIHELKRLERIRRDFVANVSHELRTPITSIKGFSETLLDGAGDNEGLRNQFLGIIHKESERMQLLIEDLLELSKIERAGFELNMENVSFSQLMEEIYLLLEKRATEKQIIFTKEIGENIHLSGDASRLKQIFLNVVNNAILYTGEGGKISLKVTGDPEYVTVTVQDSGIGIAKEEIPRIFERFYRVDKARSRDSGGTGLGLAIVKHLVEAHSGQIKVESEVDVGTTFTIILPKE